MFAVYAIREMGRRSQPALSFRSGRCLLEDYIDIPYSSAEDAVDVHGNQVQMLKRSKCFQSTTTLDLHDVPRCPQNAARCRSIFAALSDCHEPKQCGEFAKVGEQIIRNCIDCHMPLQESRVLFSNTNGKKLMPKVRNHQIAIYARREHSLNHLDFRA